MDNKKDINTAAGQAENIQNTFIFKLFQKDNFIIFVYKKFEKINSAIYLISNYLSDSEPAKWQLRTTGVSVVSRLLSLTNRHHSKLEILSETASDILRIISFLNILFNARLISEMNFVIIKKELEMLLEALHLEGLTKAERNSSKATINEDFFGLSRREFYTDVKNEDYRIADGKRSEPLGELVYSWTDLPSVNKDVNKGQTGSLNTANIDHELAPGEFIQKGKLHKRHNVENKTGYREEVILELLKDKKDLTIKDFSSVIKGCSDKTIQRELSRLVSTGVLKKSGERRWSRYSLNSKMS